MRYEDMLLLWHLRDKSVLFGGDVPVFFSKKTQVFCSSQGNTDSRHLPVQVAWVFHGDALPRQAPFTTEEADQTRNILLKYCS